MGETGEVFEALCVRTSMCEAVTICLRLRVRDRACVHVLMCYDACKSLCVRRCKTMCLRVCVCVCVCETV